jgi:capsule polysaccharide export protein KpsE/RkpR
MQDKIWLGVVGLALVIVFSISSAARTEAGAAPQQDVIRLEQRINQLEQRLYSIESSVRNVEQQSRLGGGTARGLSADELARLYTQLQTLQLRLADHECALAKLDERTLTPAMREARRKSGAGSDRCRVNPETPLRLP